MRDSISITQFRDDDKLETKLKNEKFKKKLLVLPQLS